MNVSAARFCKTTDFISFYLNTLGQGQEKSTLRLNMAAFVPQTQLEVTPQNTWFHRKRRSVLKLQR